MDKKTLGQLFKKSRERFEDLESGTLHFLQALQADQDPEYNSFTEWRQNIMCDIQKIDSDIRRCVSEKAEKPSTEMDRLVDDFKNLQGECIRRILKTDASVISIAEERLASVRIELTNLAKGRHALHGYGSAVLAPEASLNSRA